MTRREGDFQLAMPLLAESEGSDRFGLLEHLSPLPRNFQPLVIVEPPRVGATGAMRIAHPGPPYEDVLTFADPADLADYLRAQKVSGLPKGVVISLSNWPLARRQAEALERIAVQICRGRRRAERRLWMAWEGRRTAPGKEEMGARKRVVTDLGLVKVTVCQDGAAGLVWVTARPRKEATRPPVDLTRRPYVQELMKDVGDALDDEGWAVLSQAEMIAMLGRSTFPQQDLLKARGFCGILAQAPCGCRCHISPQGITTWFTLCDRDNCAARSKQLPEGVAAAQPIILGHEMPLGVLCGDCGEVGMVVTRVRRGRTRECIVEEVKCPSCGKPTRRRLPITRQTIMITEEEYHRLQ